MNGHIGELHMFGSGDGVEKGGQQTRANNFSIFL